MALPVELMGTEMNKDVEGSIPLISEKVCKSCGKIKPKSEYYNHPETADKLQTRCIDCMKSHRIPNPRPEISSQQIKLLISMLDLLPDAVKDTSWIEEERMRNLNPGLKNVGRLINRGIVERQELLSPIRGVTEKIYRLTEDGRTIAKGLEALTRKTGEVA